VKQIAAEVVGRFGLAELEEYGLVCGALVAGDGGRLIVGRVDHGFVFELIFLLGFLIEDKNEFLIE